MPNFLTRAVSRVLAKAVPATLSTVDNRGGWWPWIREPYAGAWQRNEEWRLDSVLQYPTVFACLTQIANDIGKLPLRLMREGANGIWEPVRGNSPFTPVLRKPNHYQNTIQFLQYWQICKGEHGATIALKRRDQRGIVTGMFILDPERVQIQVAPDGEVFYALNADNLTGIEQAVTVPASEIIHDRYNCLFHPLVGISPLFAAGEPALLGLKMQSDSLVFFRNGAAPGGVLEAPGSISPETAARLKEQWNSGYTGMNAGKVAVLGDGLKYTPMKMTAVDAQQVQRQEALDRYVCAAFHVPPYMVGLGTLPSGLKPGELKQFYYDTCLHTLIEDFEAVMDEGLALPADMRVELDIDALLRMDQAAQIATLGDAVQRTLYAPNEARRKLNMPPVDGGDSLYLQVQNYSLAALAERDRNHPLVVEAPAPAPTAPAPDPEPEPIDDEAERALAYLRTKTLLVEEA